MEMILAEMEKVTGKVLQALQENNATIRSSSTLGNGMGKGIREKVEEGSVCYLYRHCPNTCEDQWVSSFRYDVMRMLIKGCDHSHALCVHLCDGCTEFHVYSKKGWVSFFPDQDALVITIGDQIQAWSGGQYKHVIGRPIFKGEDDDSISMAFLYSPPPNTTYSSIITDKGKTISLAQQALIVVFAIILCQFLVYIYKKF